MSTLPTFRPVSGVPVFSRPGATGAADAVSGADFRLAEARAAATLYTGTIGVSAKDPRLDIDEITNRFVATLAPAG